MASKDEGPQRYGRFIKKNDPILDFVNVTDFNLLEIVERHGTIPDNAQNSIIHYNLHNPEEMESAVQIPSMYSTDFSTPQTRRPILIPLDFTRDWERMRKRTTRRHPRFEDEDDIELELEYLESQTTPDGKKDEGEKKPPVGKAFDFENDGFSEINAQSDSPDQEGVEGSSDPKIDRENDALEEVGRNLPSHPDHMKGASITITEAQKSEMEGSMGEQQVTPDLAEHQHQAPPEVEPQNLGQSSAQDEPREETAQGTSNMGKQEGYDQGYQEGMSQARKEQEEFQNEATGKLGQLLSEIEGLKKDILLNAQENFKNICETMLSAILRKEYSTNPEAFASIVQRAIEEAVEGDDFTIAIHPESVEDLKKFLDASLIDKMNPDEAVEKGDFQLRTKLGVIDGRASKVVEDMLDQADLNLFETKDEVS